MPLRILRRPHVSEATGDGRSTLYGKIAAGLFPRPVKLSARACGWPEHEVSAVIAARIAGKSDDEIRALVTQLEAARKTVSGGAQV